MAVINIGSPSTSGVGDCKRAIDSTAIQSAIATKLILLTKAAMISGRAGIPDRPLAKPSKRIAQSTDLLLCRDEYQVAIKVIAKAATSDKT